MVELYVSTVEPGLRRLTRTGEHRIFEFTSDSTSEDAHLEETNESKSSRGFEEREVDPHVLEELRSVSSNESQS